jgi:hypothetical protein
MFLVSTTGVTAQVSAKSLFYGEPGSTLNPYGPVGFHYWFEDAAAPLRADQVGMRVVDPRSLAAGTAVRLHIVPNTEAYLVVWLAKGSGDSRGVVLTPSQLRYAGYAVRGRREHIIGGEIQIPPSGVAASVIILMGRSQTEMVNSASGAREKIRILAARPARGGGAVAVQETDTTSPMDTGTYVIDRDGLPTGIEVPLGRP